MSSASPGWRPHHAALTRKQKRLGVRLPRHACSGFQDRSLEVSLKQLFKPADSVTESMPVETTSSEVSEVLDRSPAAMIRAIHEAAVTRPQLPDLTPATIIRAIYEATQAQRFPTEQAS